MSFVLTQLDRGPEEELLQYDNRISRMLPFAAGCVYFNIMNYNRQQGEFGVYIEWDSEVNNRLSDRLPSGGYIVKATLNQAYELHDAGQGLPVYMKLVSVGGWLYPNRIYIIWKGRPYSVEFTGCILRATVSEAGRCEAGSQKGQAVGGSNRELIYEATGSGRSVTYGSGGSNRGLLHGLGGSQRYINWQWEYEFGGSNRSVIYGSGGSNRGLLHGLGGSQRYINWQWEYEFGGSNRSVIYGSGGSNRGLLHGIGGSQRKFLYGISGSNKGLRYIANGSNSGSLYDDWNIDYTEIPYWSYMPSEWQLINKSRRPDKNIGGNSQFGYGIDLI
jgi:hypothetical protein